MKRVLWLVVAVLLWFPGRATAQSVSIETLLSAPFVENLVAAKSGNRLAWTLNEQGKRNVWVAEGPDFAARRLTSYNEDDGGELSFVRFSEDGNSVVYVRGEEKNGAGQYGNPTSNPEGAQLALLAIDWKGGEPPKLDQGGQEVTASSR